LNPHVSDLQLCRKLRSAVREAGLGHLLAQELAAAREQVLDVQPKLAAPGVPAIWVMSSVEASASRHSPSPMPVMVLPERFQLGDADAFPPKWKNYESTMRKSPYFQGIAKARADLACLLRGLRNAREWSLLNCLFGGWYVGRASGHALLSLDPPGNYGVLGRVNVKGAL
jgi:hypothetical protein